MYLAAVVELDGGLRYRTQFADDALARALVLEER